MEIGRSERIRTSGLWLPKQALYQAELRSDRGGDIAAAGGIRKRPYMRAAAVAGVVGMTARRASTAGTSGTTSYRSREEASE